MTTLCAVSRLTEYSHNTKLLVSRKLRSPVRCRLSPTLPPLPSFLPDLSFFFFAVRTLLKQSSMLAGNCKAGRWKERASCFDRRVLYCRGFQFDISSRTKQFAEGIYKGKLQFLPRISVLHDELSKRLSYTMSSTVFRHLIEVIIRQVVLVLDLCCICT
jgi:hypothetical protein